MDLFEKYTDKSADGTVAYSKTVELLSLNEDEEEIYASSNVKTRMKRIRLMRNPSPRLHGKQEGGKTHRR